MNLEEFYRQTGGNYDEAVKRFREEERIRKYLARFVGDSSFESAQKALREGNLPEAFRAVHSLKGICMNLCFDDLLGHVAALTEHLRPYSAREGGAGTVIELPPEILEESKKTEEALHRVVERAKELF